MKSTKDADMTTKETQVCVLVIDDEAPTLTMFKLFLGAYGFRVLTASSGDEGLECFETEQPDIVMTDIKMPGRDGFSILSEIKERSPDTHVIVITGHGDQDLADHALAMHASAFIHKPIKKEDLDAALKNCGVLAS